MLLRHIFVPFRCQNLKDCHEEIVFQTDFVMDLCKDSKYEHDLDVGDMFQEWEHHKVEDILTYRDRCFTSKFSGSISPAPKCSFMEAFDDSIAAFV